MIDLPRIANLLSAGQHKLKFFVMRNRNKIDWNWIDWNWLKKKAGNYKVQITTIIRRLKNYSNNQMTYSDIQT